MRDCFRPRTAKPNRSRPRPPCRSGSPPTMRGGRRWPGGEPRCRCCSSLTMVAASAQRTGQIWCWIACSRERRTGRDAPAVPVRSSTRRRCSPRAASPGARRHRDAPGARATTVLAGRSARTSCPPTSPRWCSVTPRVLDPDAVQAGRARSSRRPGAGLGAGERRGDGGGPVRVRSSADAAAFPAGRLTARRSKRLPDQCVRPAGGNGATRPAAATRWHRSRPTRQSRSAGSPATGPTDPPACRHQGHLRLPVRAGHPANLATCVVKRVAVGGPVPVHLADRRPDRLRQRSTAAAHVRMDGGVMDNSGACALGESGRARPARWPTTTTMRPSRPVSSHGY